MKRFLSYLFQIFVNYFCSVWIGVGALVILILPIRLIFKPDILTENIIVSILITFSSALSLFFLSRKTSIENKYENILYFIISYLILFLLQHIITYSLNFYGPHFSGAAQYLAEALFAPGEEFPEISQALLHLCLLAIQAFVYFPAAFLGRVSGYKNQS